MVKSGETHFVTENGSTSDRPRLIFNPSENYCGLLTYLQYYIFKDIKNVLNEFSHADNSDSLRQRILKAKE